LPSISANEKKIDMKKPQTTKANDIAVMLVGISREKKREIPNKRNGMRRKERERERMYKHGG
jgi:hypothetical protein